MRERGPDGLGAGSDKSVSIQGGFRWQNPGDLWVYISTDEVYSEVEAKLTQTVTKSISCLTFVHRLVSLNYIRGSEHAAGSCEAVDFSLTTALLFVRGYSSVFVPLLTNVMSVPQRERERSLRGMKTRSAAAAVWPVFSRHDIREAIWSGPSCVELCVNKLQQNDGMFSSLVS